MFYLIITCSVLFIINLFLLLFIRHTINNFRIVVNNSTDLEKFCAQVNHCLGEYLEFLVSLSTSEVYSRDLTFQRLMKYTREMCNILSRCKLEFQDEDELAEEVEAPAIEE